MEIEHESRRFPLVGLFGSHVGRVQPTQTSDVGWLYGWIGRARRVYRTTAGSRLNKAIERLLHSEVSHGIMAILKPERKGDGQPL